MSRQQLADLDIGERIGNGGQGAIYLVGNQPEKVLKIYHHPDSPGFRPEALDELVRHRPYLTVAGLRVEQWAAWPESIVADGNRTVGFLMSRVDSRFELVIHQKSHLALLGYLLRPAAPAWQGSVELPDQAARCKILAQLAAILQAVHHRGLVIGDLSHGNAVWAIEGHPPAFLLDCDSIRMGGMPPVFPQGDTQDWTDPLGRPGSPPDQDRDNYKLALAVLRTLIQRTDARPDEPADLPGLPENLAQSIGVLLARAAGPAGTRPTAQEWRTVLEGRTVSGVQDVSVREPRTVPGKDHLLYDPDRQRVWRDVPRRDSRP